MFPGVLKKEGRIIGAQEIFRTEKLDRGDLTTADSLDFYDK